MVVSHGWFVILHLKPFTFPYVCRTKHWSDHLFKGLVKSHSWLSGVKETKNRLCYVPTDGRRTRIHLPLRTPGFENLLLYSTLCKPMWTAKFRAKFVIICRWSWPGTWGSLLFGPVKDVCVVIIWFMTQPLEKWLCVAEYKMILITYTDDEIVYEMRKDLYWKRWGYWRGCHSYGVAEFNLGQVDVWFVADRIWWKISQFFIVVFHFPLFHIHWPLIQELVLRPQSYGDRLCATRIMKRGCGLSNESDSSSEIDPDSLRRCKGRFISSVLSCSLHFSVTLQQSVELSEEVCLLQISLVST